MSAPDFSALCALAESRTVEQLLGEFPVTADFLLNYNLTDIDTQKTLAASLTDVGAQALLEFGLTPEELPGQLAAFLASVSDAAGRECAINTITVLGGRDKSGALEDVTLEIGTGSIISIVGPTGSGKSRLLGDIECLAQRDTPTGRKILLNGGEISEEERFLLDGKIVAQLSQNMNFVMDLTVSEFLELHARSRSVGSAADVGDVIDLCFACANSLAGERFYPDTKVTQLSGGQSRALMIADAAYMSRSSIVLIDEIENAGVDRVQAVALLARREKIVLISTHDPLLALSADKRIVIKNGGISAIIETSPEEKECLSIVERLDRKLQDTRGKIRSGERISARDLEEV